MEWLLHRLFGRCHRRESDWIYDENNSMKRTCRICGQREWMFVQPYPSETRPSINWRQMP